MVLFVINRRSEKANKLSEESEAAL